MQADKYSITNFINITINGSTITSTNVIFWIFKVTVTLLCNFASLPPINIRPPAPLSYKGSRSWFVDNYS
jgi:hypothetical protein